MLDSVFRESENRLPGRLIELSSRGISLYIREEGSGFPVLLMHGGPGADHSTLLSLLPLARSYRLIFYDHRCNGRSSKPELSTMDWDNLTADADAIRQHFGIQRWAVIGHSFGGMVALEYAIRYPHNLTNLVLLDTGGDSVWVQKNASSELEKKGHSRLVVETAARFYSGAIAQNEFMRSMMILGKAYYSHPRVGLLLREAFHGLRIHACAGACIRGFKELLSGWSVMDKLGQIGTRTLILAGNDDFQFPPAHQRELQTGIPGSKLELLADAGHNAHIEQAGKIVALIEGFLEDG